MAIQNFDELNSFREMATKWFDVMDIPQSDKDKRVDLSLDYCEIMIMLFLMITEQEAERYELIAYAEERIRIIAEQQIGTEDMAYINDFAKTEAERIVDETYEKYENEIEDQDIEEETEEKTTETETSEETKDTYKFSEFNVEIPKKEYWTSDFRALLLGIQLSTTVCNFDELMKAIEAGCTRKVWITEGDERVRPTHDEVFGVDIPINEYFTVGDSVLLMPGDTNNGAELKEILNCRCHLNCY